MDTTLLIKTKKDLKTRAQEVSAELGVPLSTVMNAFLKQFVRDKEITLSTSTYRMTPYLEGIIKEARQSYKNKKDISPIFTSAKEAIAWLNK